MCGKVDVLVSGDVFADLVFSGCRIQAPGTEEFAKDLIISPGGAANRAVAAARLGARTSLLAPFGDDPIGMLAVEKLKKEPNLDLSHCVFCAGASNPITVSITDGEDRAFVTYQEALPDAKWHDDDTAAGTVFVDLGSDSTIPDWALKLREKGAILFAGLGWDSAGEWDKHLLERLRQVDVVLMNEMEATAYTGSQSVEKALDILMQYTHMAIVTLGSEGVTAAEGGNRLKVPALPVQAVDPTGAGDTFSAAVMVGMAWGWTLEQSLLLATAVAACCVQQPGGAISAPSPQRISELIDQLEYEQGERFVRRWMFLKDWATRQSTHNRE